MAISLAQSKEQAGASQSTSPSITLTSAATAGQLIVVAFHWNENAGDTTITTPSGFTLLNDVNRTGLVRVAMFYKVAAGGEQTISATLGASRPWGVTALVFDGVDGTPLDKKATATGTSSPASSGTTATTATADEVCIAAIASRADFSSPTNSFTMDFHTSVTSGSSLFCGMFHRIVSATGTYSVGATSTGTSGYAGQIATFKASLAASVGPAGAIASSAAFGSPNVTRTVAPTGRASSAAFGSPTVTPGAVGVSPSGIGSSSALGSPTVRPATWTLSPGGIATSVQLGTPSLTQNIKPSGIASSAAFGTLTVSPGPVTISPGGIASSVAFGTPQVQSGGAILAFGIASSLTFGSPTVTTGPVTVSPSGRASSVAFGSPTVTPGPVSVLPAAISSSGARGTPTVTPAPRTISPTGIPDSVLFGTPIVRRGDIFPTGIPSGSAFGSPTVTPGPRTLSPTGIPSAAAVGTPARYDQLAPTGIPSSARMGSARFYPSSSRYPSTTLYPRSSGIDVILGVATIHPSGRASTAAVGTPTLQMGVRTVAPAGIGSVASIGTPTLTTNSPVISPAGISRTVQFGVPAVDQLHVYGWPGPVGPPARNLTPGTGRYPGHRQGLDNDHITYRRIRYPSPTILPNRGLFPYLEGSRGTYALAAVVKLRGSGKVLFIRAAQARSNVLKLFGSGRLAATFLLTRANGQPGDPPPSVEKPTMIVVRMASGSRSVQLGSAVTGRVVYASVSRKVEIE